ncbi:MAG: endonuclease domain-containing protein [Clostridia bacterium]|nr:endonuclease domain-containing protein [Clostridia bacterium]
MHKHNKTLTETARKLRKNMTPQEKKIWYQFLCDYPVRILRQKVITRFIADFYCKKANLVIEIDGKQHYNESDLEKDRERTQIIESFGLKVVRFSNDDIDNNFEKVCNTIDKEIIDRLN